ELRHHVTERALAAEVGGYPRMVYHVVAMHRTGGSLQDRREVSMGDAEAGQVSGDAGGVSEPELGLKLQPVAGLRCGRDGHGRGLPPGGGTQTRRRVSAARWRGLLGVEARPCQARHSVETARPAGTGPPWAGSGAPWPRSSSVRAT